MAWIHQGVAPEIHIPTIFWETYGWVGRPEGWTDGIPNQSLSALPSLSNFWYIPLPRLLSFFPPPLPSVTRDVLPEC